MSGNADSAPFFDLLTEECDECDSKGRIEVNAYGNSTQRVPCYFCKGTKQRPSPVGRELLEFVKRYTR